MRELQNLDRLPKEKQRETLEFMAKHEREKRDFHGRMYHYHDERLNLVNDRLRGPSEHLTAKSE